MTAHTDDDATAADAPSWYPASEAGAWADGWNAAREKLAPAIAARAAADALVAFADAHRMPFVMFRREDGSAVTVSDLLREESARLRGRAGQVNP